MKKRVFSALLVLCMACSLVSTVWAADDAMVPTPTSTQETLSESKKQDEDVNADNFASTDELESAEDNSVASSGKNNIGSEPITFVPEDESSADSSSQSQTEQETNDEKSNISQAAGLAPENQLVEDEDYNVDDPSLSVFSAQPSLNGIADSEKLVRAVESDYSVAVGQTIHIDGKDAAYNNWSIVSGDGSCVNWTAPWGSLSSSIEVTGLKPGIVTFKHETGAQGTEYFVVEVTQDVRVYVYVASRVTDEDGNLVQPEISWSDNPEFLDLLGLSETTVDANKYFPVGEIYLPLSFFQGKDSPYLKGENDWETVKAALQKMDTTTLAGEYAANSNNRIKEYIDQVIMDENKEAGKQCSALFDWSGSSYGFSGGANYHLDLRFNTKTITFKTGNNGISGDIAADNTVIEQRVYITGSEIQSPKEFPVPVGYKLVGYYEDYNLQTVWNGIGTPLTEDKTVYIKIAPKENVTISYHVAEGSGTLGRDYEAFNPAANSQGSNAIPTDGYVFVGWYSDEACTNLVSNDATFVPQAPEGGWPEGANYNYYAKFEPDVHSITIVKDIYGLPQDEVENLIERDVDALRFDVDGFTTKDKLDNDEKDETPPAGDADWNDWGDRTFDVKDTLADNDDLTDGSWTSEVTETGNTSIGKGEGQYYIEITMEKAGDSTEENPHYTYSVTITDMKANIYYRVWELNSGVDGYDLTATVQETYTGSSSDTLESLLKNRTDATAFHLTDDITVVFTNTYARQHGDLILDKAVYSDNNSELKPSDSFTFKVQASEDLVDEVKGKTFTGMSAQFDDQGTAEISLTESATVTIKNLPTGTYTVTEVNPAEEITVEDTTYYYLSEKSTTSAEADVTKDDQKSVCITNIYAPYYELTITKEVLGEMGETKRGFAFDNAAITRNGQMTQIENIQNNSLSVGNDTIGVVITDLNNDGTAVSTATGFTLGDQESIQLKRLKKGDTITFTENNYTSEGYKAPIYTSDNDTICSEITIGDNTPLVMNVKVTNNRPPVAPTGLETNHTTPYVLMITAAGMAGLALIGGIVARRIRRRRQE